jgi:hypothetical protein
VHGTIVRAPACAGGCPLSGDGTIVLYRMTWTSWTARAATGTGTEDIETCQPSCATGADYQVPVVVTLTGPMRDCASGSPASPAGPPLYLWTRAAFRWPRGLPAALRGASAPYNPWTFTALQGDLGC